MNEEVQRVGAVATDDAAKNPSTTKSTLLAYLSENPLKLGSAATLFVGGLLTLLFFLRIGYMPDVNVESLSSLLYAVALLGLFLTAYFMVLLVLPGLMLAMAKESTTNVSFSHLFVLSVGAALIWVLILCNFFELVASPVAIIAGVGIAVWFPGIAGHMDRGPQRQPPESQETACSTRKRWDSRADRKQIYGWSLAVLVSMVAILSVTILFVGAIGMSGDIRRASSAHVLKVMAVLVGAIALSAAVIGGVRKADTYKVAAVLAPVLLVLALILTGSFTALPAIAVRALGQGEIAAARIVVDGRTCREISQALGQRVCAEADPDAPTAICPVMIRSRIGSELVLDFAPMAVSPTKADEVPRAYWVVGSDADDGGKVGTRWMRRVVVKKIKLLSWQPLRGFEEGSKQLSELSPVPAVAAWLSAAAVNAMGGEGARDDLVLANVLEARCGHRLIDP